MYNVHVVPICAFNVKVKVKENIKRILENI